MMVPLLSLFSLLFPLAAAVPCVQFDTAWNLYAFGGSQDVNLGQASSWSQPSPQTLTSQGRPSWTGNNTQCFLSQYNNAMYVLGGDADNLSKIYIYNFASSSWSSQSTSSPPSDYGNTRSATVLDHDTNVFFTLTTNSGLYQLSFNNITNEASDSPIAWQAVENPSFSTSGYQATAAQASNHIEYFGVPSTPAGEANIFIIHFAKFQEAPQSFPTQNGGQSFPDQSGQAISIPSDNQSGSPPFQMVFVPDDFSNTYVVTHWTNPSNYTITNDSPMPLDLVNSTQLVPAPSSKDPRSAYAASVDSIVQIDTNGDIYYVDNAITNYAVNSGASWQKMSYSLSGVSGSSSSSSSASAASGSASATMSGSSKGDSGEGAAATSGAASSGSKTATMSSGSKSSSSSSSKPSGAAEPRVGEVRWGMVAAALGLVGAGAAVVL